MHLPTHELNFLFEMWWKTIFCAKYIYCHSTERWQSSVRVQSFKINVASLHSPLSYLIAVQHQLCIFCAQNNCFMRWRQGQKPRAFMQSHIIPHCLDMNTFSEMFERHCQERSLLYVILKLLAYFASFCCLHKSLLLLHVSCKHVQTMP